ncbi:MAG: PDGLE domain-containing protein [Thermoanaerobacteraceae bacterium]|nr:PDGLE domain-containing protein [Thermoanaerobacteraceae bacterium]
MDRRAVRLLLVTVVVVLVLAPFASSFPDGLERVAEDLGFLSANHMSEINVAIMPDYEVPGLGGYTGTVLTGLFGVAVTFLLTVGLGKLFIQKK